MKNKQNEIENDDIFKNIEFNRNEIKTDENFFEELNGKNSGDDVSLDLDKSEDSFNSDKLDLCDKSMEEQMNKVTLNDEKVNKTNKKITKDDLRTIPIPIFECVFCADEYLSFRHYINEILSLKYLYNAEKKDINLIDFLLSNNNLLEIKEEKNDLLKNLGKKNNIDLNKIKSLIDTILDNKEYLKKYYSLKESKNILKQKRIRDNNNKLKNEIFSSHKKADKMELNINLDFPKEKYGNNKIELFDDDNNDDEDFIEKINKNICDKLILDNNNEKRKGIDDDIGFEPMFGENCFMDLSRKIKKGDIIFEDKPYNIWENDIDDSLEKDS